MLKGIAAALSLLALAYPTLARSDGVDERGLRMEFQEKYDALKGALQKHDDAALRLIIAPEYSVVSTDGSIESGQKVISRLQNLDDPHGESVTTIKTARVMGEEAIVERELNYKTARLGRDKLPHRIEIVGSYTDTWTKDASGWRILKSLCNEQEEFVDGQSYKHSTAPNN